MKNYCRQKILAKNEFAILGFRWLDILRRVRRGALPVLPGAFRRRVPLVLSVGALLRGTLTRQIPSLTKLALHSPSDCQRFAANPSHGCSEGSRCSEIEDPSLFSLILKIISSILLPELESNSMGR